jgi:GAF domain-containing protein
MIDQLPPPEWWSEIDELIAALADEVGMAAADATRKANAETELLAQGSEPNALGVRLGLPGRKGGPA